MAEECCIGPVRPNEVDGAIRDRTEAARRDEEHRPPCLRNGPRCNASDALTDLVELENEGDADILPAPYLVTLKDKQIFAASNASDFAAVRNDLQITLVRADRPAFRSEEHTSELPSLMRISYAVFCLKKNNKTLT